MLTTQDVLIGLSTLPVTDSCCRLTEIVAQLRFAGAVMRADESMAIRVDFDSPKLAQRMAATFTQTTAVRLEIANTNAQTGFSWSTPLCDDHGGREPPT